MPFCVQQCGHFGRGRAEHRGVRNRLGRHTGHQPHTGAFLGAKHQIAQMLKNRGGSVIFTSTFAGYTGAFPGTAAYAASESGLIGPTQALAAEKVRHGAL